MSLGVRKEGVLPLAVLSIKTVREYNGGYSVTKYVSKDCDCVDKTLRFSALLVETQVKWKVLKCEQVKIANHLYVIFHHESVQRFPP